MKSFTVYVESRFTVAVEVSASDYDSARLQALTRVRRQGIEAFPVCDMGPPHVASVQEFADEPKAAE